MTTDHQINSSISLVPYRPQRIEEIFSQSITAYMGISVSTSMLVANFINTDTGDDDNNNVCASLI